MTGHLRPVRELVGRRQRRAEPVVDQHDAGRAARRVRAARAGTTSGRPASSGCRRPQARSSSRPLAGQHDERGDDGAEGKVLGAGAAGEEGRDETVPPEQARQDEEGEEGEPATTRTLMPPPPSCPSGARQHGAHDPGVDPADQRGVGATSTVAHLDDGAHAPRGRARRARMPGRPGAAGRCPAAPRRAPRHECRSVAVAGSMPHSRTSTSRMAKRARTESGGARKMASAQSSGVGLGHRAGGRQRRRRTSRRGAARMRATGCGAADGLDASAPDPHGGRGGEPATGAV